MAAPTRPKNSNPFMARSPTRPPSTLSWLKPVRFQPTVGRYWRLPRARAQSSSARSHTLPPTAKTQATVHPMYDDPNAAFSREGRGAGNEVLAKMFGSPDASCAIADQAEQYSGVSSAILKKLLP